jgi:hypothetical protein
MPAFGYIMSRLDFSSHTRHLERRGNGEMLVLQVFEQGIDWTFQLSVTCFRCQRDHFPSCPRLSTPGHIAPRPPGTTSDSLRATPSNAPLYLGLLGET